MTDTRDSSLEALGNPLPTCAVCGTVIMGHHDCERRSQR